MWGLDDEASPVDFAKLTALVKFHEGYKAKPYTDSTGHISIGWGINLSDGINVEEAEWLLSYRLRSAIREAQAQPWWVCVSDNDARARAFCELVFNLGLERLAGFRKALDAAMRREWPACAAALLDSLWHHQVGVRAEVIASMVLTGSDPNPA